MIKEKVRYIVKRNYTTTRTGTDAFVKLMRKSSVESEKKPCYNKADIRKGGFSFHNPKED